MTREDYAIKKFTDVMKDCREQLVNDVYNADNDLYRYLLCDRNSKVSELYRQRYELKWLVSHWQKSQEVIQSKDIPMATRHELLRLFMQIHQQFVSAWGYSPMDAFFFDAKIDSLDALIATDQKWQDTLNKMQISFMKADKALEKQIKEAEIE